MNTTNENPLGTNKKATREDQGMIRNERIWLGTLVLAAAGGLAFWLANFAISRTPIAAEYRTALSISYNPMLFAALVGGLIIGLLVSYCLLRFYDRVPGKDPMLKAVILSMMAMVIVTILIGGPSSFQETNDVWRYFTIGTIFNFIRILALGIAIGYVFKRWGGRAGVSLHGHLTEKFSGDERE